MKNVVFILLLTTMAISAFTLSKQSKTIGKTKTFVLVHGAWQAPYAWDNVKKQLEKKGNKVIVIDLPGHGDDQTTPEKISIDVYRDKVIEAINDSKEKVILVGHSMAGIVISAVAEKIPGQVEKLVYVGAYVPENGQSLFDLANTDKQSLLGPSIIPSKDQLTLDVKKENLISIFCQDGSENVKKMLLSNYKAEPAIPFTNKVALTKENFGSVDKYYIRTLQDHAVGINLQNQMISAAHITKIASMSTGHCPFLSKPDEISKLLLSYIN